MPARQPAMLPVESTRRTRMNRRFEHLVDQLQRGKIDRRTFMVRAFALGVSGTAVFSALSRVGLVEAQGEKATDIGNPDIPHITTTDKGTIKLYSSWPFTGVMEAIGADAVEATKLALSDYGSAAGGFALEYVSLDDGIAANNGGWDAGAESANANKALADPDAMVYLGTYNSGAAKISIPIMNEAGMAQISFANTYPGLTKAIKGATEEGEPDVYYPTGKRNYMRTVPADDVQGVAGANWAYESKGARKAYVLDDQSLYGHGVAQVFNNAFRELGGEVLGAEGWDKNAPDYQALMTKIADMGPDIVYLGATVENNTPKVVLDLRSLMPVDQVTCLLPDGLITSAFIDGAGDAAEGAFVTFAGFPPAELKGPGADYATRMTEILGHAPDSYAVYAYEVVAVVIQAIDQVQEKDRGKILDAMMATKNFRSLLGGTWSFTEEGDTDALTMSLNEIKPNDEGKLDFAFVEAIGS
jgi:branched-chain amino acid transport system substrate-binding protein